MDVRMFLAVSSRADRPTSNSVAALVLGNVYARRLRDTPTNS